MDTFQIGEKIESRDAMTGRHPSTAEQVRGLLIIAGCLFITWAVAMCVVLL